MEPTADFNKLYNEWITSRTDDTVVFCYNDVEIRVGEINALVNRYADELRQRGIGPGKGVGFALPDCPEVFALFFAVWRLGAYAVPLFPMIPDPMKVGVFSAARVVLAITASAALESLAAEVRRQQAPFSLAAVGGEGASAFGTAIPVNDEILPVPVSSRMPAMVAASSGTTGVPKIVMMDRGNIASALRCSAEMAPDYRPESNGDWRSTLAFPLSTSGMLVCAGLLFGGVTLVFSEDLSPVTYLSLTGKWGAQLLSAPPSYFETLCTLPGIDPCVAEKVTGIMTGMDFLSPSLLERLGKRFPQLQFCSVGYGLVETSTVFMVQKPEMKGDSTGVQGSFLIAGGVTNEITVRDKNGAQAPDGTPGELWVRGPSVVREYAGNQEATQQAFVDGWFRTGDVAVKNGTDAMELLGRDKYLIKRGGKSVSPLMVQEKITAIPGIRECAVVGVPHPLYGQMIWAFVVPETSTDGIEKAVMKQCRETLPNYMVPDTVRFLQQLPRGRGAGKLDIEQLLRTAGEELAAMEEDQHG